MDKKIKWIIGLLIVVIGTAGFAGYLSLTTPRITFMKEAVLEVHTKDYDPLTFIEAVANGDQQDVTIKRNAINPDVVGSYEIEYQLGSITSRLMVKVVDSIPPKVVTQEPTIEVKDALTPEQCIKEIHDETKTSAAFKTQYRFDVLGEYPVTVYVTDEGGNCTSMDTIVHVVAADTIPPVITAQDITLPMQDSFDALAYAQAMDERDGVVSVEVLTSTVEPMKPGSYQVVYQARDAKGNISTKEISVIVQAKNTSSDKIIYLTIDDGPSANTPAILDILDRYQVKATFFVTAQCPQYYHYIGLAAAKGHAIGLHTYSHDYAAVYASDQAYFNDLQRISDIVVEQSGQRSMILRFPGGSSNTISANYNTGIMSRLTKAVQQRGYRYFDWNSSSGDGNSAAPSATLIANAKSYGGRSPLMFLSHDHAGSRSSVEALPAIIEYYQGLGYAFLTIDTSTNGYHHGVQN